MTCVICILPFNKSTQSMITCPDAQCAYAACKECVRTYLLGTTSDPHCMSCRKAYDPEFQTANFNASWMTNTYKKHRKTLLLEREISKLPATMGKVQQYEQVKTLEKINTDLKKRMYELNLELYNCKREKNINNRNIDLTRNGQSTEINKNKFIMPCPDDNCRGFLSSAYKCEACKLYTCSKCHEVTGLDKINEEHVCNEDNVKSAALIKKETKPCPSCGTRIQKLSGCDQMWCPGCKNAFSWKTGQVDTGVIHNPHFYAWQKENGQGAAPRNPGDIVCGGLQNYWRTRSMILARMRDAKEYSDNNLGVSHTNVIRYRLEEVTRLYQMLHNLGAYSIDRLRTDVRAATDNESERVQYILKHITTDQLATTICRKDKLRKKNIELLHVWELILTVGTENFNEFCTNQADNSLMTHAEYLVIFNQHHDTLMSVVNNILQYCNNRFAMISATFSCKTPLISLSSKIEESHVSLTIPHCYSFKIMTQKSSQRVLKTKQNTLYPNAEGAV